MEDFKFSGMNRHLLYICIKVPSKYTYASFMMIVGEEILNKVLLLINLETSRFHLFSRKLSPTPYMVHNMYIRARHNIFAAITSLSEDHPHLRSNIPNE
jgi:hypothetical protein